MAIMAAALRRLRADMGRMRFLDPACGCGNFLVIAYRELRALDLEILVRIQELAATGQHKFIPAAHLPAGVICSHLNFAVRDRDGFAFAVASSSMLTTWQKAVGGRLESRLRFSNTLVWNTFPLPAVDPATRAKLIEAGQGVLVARALHPDWSLADHYNPLAMTPELLKAHAALDRVMDKAMGAKRALHDNDERLAILFANYEKMTREPELRLRGRELRGK